MGARRIRREQRQVDMTESRRFNSLLKDKERARRDLRMLDLIQKSKLPFIPSIMSWLSNKLDKPATRITQADVDQVVKNAKS